MIVPRFALALVLVLVTIGCGSEGATHGASRSPAAGTSPSVDAGDCPTTQAARGVPEPPKGFDGDKQLIPSGTPDSALLCEYADGELRRGVALAGDLAPLADELALPVKYGSHPCTLIGRGGPLISYLLRVTVRDTTAWVQSESDPNSCSETGNGSFASDAYEADVLATWLQAGRWVARQPRPGASPSPCAYLGAGRPGDEKALLPGKPTQVRVCSSSSASYRDLTAQQIGELQQILNDVRTQPSTNGCQGAATDPINVSAAYTEGRLSILRYMPGCDPELDNSLLAGKPTPEQDRQLRQLLRTSD
ncbi:MAG: hypothetical protein QOE05_477 [Actinomycetota bacterium]|jgi:hypothetical protein|nr:hypothetical protein [Actinomycetota bacterium]